MKKNLIAVVNDELLMLSKSIEMDELDFCEDLEHISEAITKKVTTDARFIKAVGKDNAKKACFHLWPVCFECDDCGELAFIIRVLMMVGETETDFYYDYCLQGGSCGVTPEEAQCVVYTYEGRSQLMKVFESYYNGVTSAKTFKNGCDEEAEGAYLEKIYAEILSDADVAVV